MHLSLQNVFDFRVGLSGISQNFEAHDKLENR